MASSEYSSYARHILLNNAIPAVLNMGQKMKSSYSRMYEIVEITWVFMFTQVIV